jgi:hypothetical protein
MTHDYTSIKRFWGHDYAITNIKDQGKEIHIIGWGLGLKKRDYLLLTNYDYNETTRYRIKKIKYKADPSDMWILDATFAPRRQPITV